MFKLFRHKRKEREVVTIRMNALEPGDRFVWNDEMIEVITVEEAEKLFDDDEEMIFVGYRRLHPCINENVYDVAKLYPCLLGDVSRYQ